MPFDSLSPEQQKFITKYFKSTGLFSRSKTISKADEINNAFSDAVTPVVERINALRTLIDEVDANYEHAPVSTYESRLDEVQGKLKGILDKKKSEIAKGKLPDFSEVLTDLDALEKRINARVENAKSGKGVDKLAGLKEAHVEETLLRLQSEGRPANELISNAMRNMPLLLEEDFDARNKAVHAWRQKFDAARADVNKIASDHVGKDETVLDEFKQLMKRSVDGFVADGKTELDILTALLNKPPFNFDAEKAKFATDPRYKEQAVIKRELMRNGAATKEHDKIEKALKNQQKELDVLRTAFADAPRDEQKEIRAAFKAKQGDVMRLEMRDQQFAKYEELEEERQRILVKVVWRAEAASVRAGAIETQLQGGRPDNIDELNEKLAALAARPQGFHAHPTADYALTAIGELEAEVGLSAKREVVLAKLDRAEPPVMELSAGEMSALLSLLKSARACVASNCLDHASALMVEVQDDMFAFKNARRAIALPPPEPPKPSGSEKLLAQLNAQIAQCLDLAALGVEGAEAKADEINALRGQAKAALSANEAADLTPFQNEAKYFGGQIGALGDPPPRSAALEQQIKAASDTSDAVAKILDGLLRTKLIDDSDIIEQPGQTYSKAEQGKLVRADEMIYVRNEQGELEKHKILHHRKGKGGEDLARRDEKSVPREVTDALRQKAETLRMMGEMAGEESGEAVEEYRKEVEIFAQNVAQYGPTLYPQAEAVIKECDKLFSGKPLSEFIPADYGKVRAPFDQFRDSWRSKGPQEALSGAQDHKAQTDQLVIDAEKVKVAYGKGKDLYASIRKDLTGKKNKEEDSDPLGKLMKASLGKTPEDFFAGATHNGDRALYEQLKKAEKEFASVKKFYAENKKQYPADQMSGTWMTQTENALKKMNAKDADNVAEATRDLEKIRGAMKTFAGSMGNVGTAKGTDLAKLLIELTQKMAASARDVIKHHNERAAFLRAADALKKQLKVLVALAKKKSKNPAAKALLANLNALEQQFKAAVTNNSADESWSAGTAEIEGIEQQSRDIETRLGGLKKEGGEKIKNMRIGEKPEALEKIVKEMQARAKALANTKIRPMLPDPDPQNLAATLGKVDTNLAGLDKLPKIDTIKSLGRDIDKWNDQAEDGANTKAERVAGREKMLAEIRKFRNALETHPSVLLYRSNPFDMGTDVRLAQTALHQLEIATLACVGPREKDAVL